MNAMHDEAFTENIAVKSKQPKIREQKKKSKKLSPHPQCMRERTLKALQR